MFFIKTMPEGESEIVVFIHLYFDRMDGIIVSYRLSRIKMTWRAENQQEGTGMNWVHLLAGPLIGAVIGYCTNYIAVKMMFRPRRGIRLGRWQLPFTPGVIPKRKDQLAHAVGQAVGTQLFTATDVKELLLSDEMKQSVTTAVLGGMSGENRTLSELFRSGMGGSAYDQCRESLCQRLCTHLETGIQEMDLGMVIAQQGSAAIKEKVSGTMMAMFFHDRTINALSEAIRSGIDRYLEENMHEMLLHKIETEVDSVSGKTPAELCQSVSADTELLRKVVEQAYQSLVTAKANQMLGSFQISEVVEEKIKDMDVEEIEELVLSVMKNELRTIVSLGGLIGFVIGIINVFVG